MSATNRTLINESASADPVAFKLTHADITPIDEKSANIINLIREINIKQDIKAPFLDIELILFDSTSIFETLKINGGEKLELNFQLIFMDGI